MHEAKSGVSREPRPPTITLKRELDVVLVNLDKCSTHRAGIPRSAAIAGNIFTDDRAATIAGRPTVFADPIPHILAGTTTRRNYRAIVYRRGDTVIRPAVNRCEGRSMPLHIVWAVIPGVDKREASTTRALRVFAVTRCRRTQPFRPAHREAQRAIDTGFGRRTRRSARGQGR